MNFPKNLSHRILDIPILQIVIGMPPIILMCILSFYNYLLFHSLVEIFAVVVTGMIFLTAWVTQNYMTNHYLLFLGISYLFIGLIDLLHALAYKGMGVFPNATANEPTQLWIMARYMESISLLIAPTYAHRKVSTIFWGTLYLILTIAGFLAIFQFKVFPDCYLEGKGLTTFKISSEYLICAILAISILRLKHIQEILDPRVFRLIMAAIITTIIAELAFTFYVSVYGLSNMVGHIFRLLSFALVLEGLIRTGIRDPFSVLFRQLKKEKESLESALKEVRTLQGLLPICSFCKKIRDDEGYWHNLENYISSKTEAMFSHGLCPDCLNKHYPEIADDVLGETNSSEQEYPHEKDFVNHINKRD
ncbi:MAG: MASE3 domain-containing protein [Thermodesulforhabdaceae bacterium]